MKYAKSVTDVSKVEARLRGLTEEAVRGFVEQLSRYFKEPIDPGMFQVEVLPPPHFPRAMPPGKQSVFAFYWPKQGQFLLVALAGPNSNARFQSQHYLPASSGSNLARKILQHKKTLGIEDLEKATVGMWMKGNLARINIFLPASVDKEILKYLKDYLKLIWSPMF